MDRTGTCTILGALALSLLISGCIGEIEVEDRFAAANREECGGTDCHPEAVTAQADGSHSTLPCTQCHEGTGEAHAADPKAAVAATDWTVDGCAPCHEGEAATYLYDDNAQVGPYGGSQREPAQPKTDTFPEYNTIVAGHAFAREYNEEGAHAYMLEDHYATTRGKFEACMQCKSTKVALAWDSGKPLRVAADTPITLTHTATEGVPPKKVTIPKGTVVSYATDPQSLQVDASAEFPDGTTWTSRPTASEDATQNFNMLWASTVAATKDTWPYGAGCNHCHDPHTGGERLVRKAMLRAIEGTGGPEGSGGVNPYRQGAEKDWTTAPKKDRLNLLCAQCHVEYVCGKSGVDKVDRDSFGWSKAADLHGVYSDMFDYSQDWKNAIMGEPLIKSQHPEMELYWESTHYDAGAACADCHMPEVGDGANETFRSHWFTSPYKYGDEGLRAAFAAKTGVTAKATANPCRRCHEDRTGRAIEQQRTFFSAQSEVEKLLARSVREYGALRAAAARGEKVGTGALADALDAHRQAHVIWENLAVSENSMSFHNHSEAMESMAEAKKQVTIALAKEKEARPK